MKHELTGTGRIIRFDMRGLRKVSRLVSGCLTRSPKGKCIIAGCVDEGGGRFRWHAFPADEVIYTADHPVLIEAPDRDVRTRVFFRDGFEVDAPTCVCILENGHVTQRAAGPLDSEDWE
jgi:hypothetical protein